MMVIGNYRILEKIGEGGMGVIYKAEHCTLEQIVAIKALPEALSANSDLRERFIREAKIQAKLSHPNVVNIHNFYEFEGNYYIVMEYVEGETLESLIRTKGLIPPDSCINIFKQILAGIGYAHSMGIIHRDVKPSNIIIKKDGVIKITDFGIAKLAGDMMKTQPGIKVGTIWYMSPEQVKGQPAGIASDIYSLGITLFEMITGKVPFSGNSEYSIMKDIVECSPPSPREFYPYVPVSMESTILKAISKEPEERFKCIEEFAAALTTIHESPKVFYVNTDGNLHEDRVIEHSGFFSRWRKVLIPLTAVLASIATLLLYYNINGIRKWTSEATAGGKVVISPPVVAPIATDVKLEDKIAQTELLDLLKKGKACNDKQDYKSSAAAYERALQIDKANVDARRGSELAANGLEEQKNRSIICDYIETARSYHKNGTYGKSIDMYKKALVLDSGNKDAHKGIEDAQIAREAEAKIGTLKR